jgi:hypothetical protein
LSLFYLSVQTKAELLKKAEQKRKEAVKQQELLINSKQVSSTNAQSLCPRVQCCGSGIYPESDFSHSGSDFFHPGSEFFHPGSRVKKISVSGSAYKNLGFCLTPKKVAKLAEI